MKRLIEETVFWGLVTAWRLATVPTRRSPDAVKATTEGVVRPPSAFSMTVGSPPSSTAMHEFVVPRSIPMVLPMSRCSLSCGSNLSGRVADYLRDRDWHVRTDLPRGVVVTLPIQRSAAPRVRVGRGFLKDCEDVAGMLKMSPGCATTAGRRVCRG